MEKIIISLISLLFSISSISISTFAQEFGKFTDPRDGKTYKTVKLGKQTWMAENLAYKASSGYWDDDNDQSYVKTFGYLYNWNTAMKVCPSGWHLPTDDEWTTLTNYLGGEYRAGGKLKETGTSHWLRPNTGATNITGFTALPGGEGDVSGLILNNGSQGYWWSSTMNFNNTAWIRTMIFTASSLARAHSYIYIGCSVRCLKN